MSLALILFVLLILGVIIFFIDFYLVKVLKISRPKKKMFDQGRKKFFVVSEVSVFIGFVVSMLVLAGYFSVSPNVAILPIFLFLALVFLIRGVEEFMLNKRAKGYYHDWVGSFALLCTFTLLFFAR